MPAKGRKVAARAKSRHGKAAQQGVRIVGRAPVGRSRARMPSGKPRAQARSSARQWRAEGPARPWLAGLEQVVFFVRSEGQARARKVSPISLHSLLVKASTKMCGRRFAWGRRYCRARGARRGKAAVESRPPSGGARRRRSATPVFGCLHIQHHHAGPVDRQSDQAPISAGAGHGLVVVMPPQPEETRGLVEHGVVSSITAWVEGSSAPA